MKLPTKVAQLRQLVRSAPVTEMLAGDWAHDGCLCPLSCACLSKSPAEWGRLISMGYDESQAVENIIGSMCKRGFLTHNITNTFDRLIESDILYGEYLIEKYAIVAYHLPKEVALKVFDETLQVLMLNRYNASWSPEEEDSGGLISNATVPHSAETS